MKKWHWLAIGRRLPRPRRRQHQQQRAERRESLCRGRGEKDIESIVSASGQIDPKVKVNISAHVIGKVDRVYFEEVDYV